MFLFYRVTDGFHVGEDDAPVAALQFLHELQVAADLEALDRLLLQEKVIINTWLKGHCTNLNTRLRLVAIQTKENRKLSDRFISLKDSPAPEDL